MKNSFKNTALVLAVMLTMAMLFTACNENETPVTASADGTELLAPTIPPPAGGWTTEEQALITEFGEIEEVGPSSDFISGIKLKAEYEIEQGKRPSCAGASGWCELIFKGFSVGWTPGPSEVGVSITFVNNVPMVKVDSKDNDGDGDQDNDPVPGSTDNGLFPVWYNHEMPEDVCDEIGAVSAAITPGLYIKDSNGDIYMNLTVEWE